jgi:uncharacterized protein (DUF486 family)
MNEKTLNKTYLRTLQYWFDDGIVELGLGGLFLALGGYFYIQTALENSWLADWFSGVFALLFIGGWYLVQAFIRSLKERFTFPRTGYVAYRKDENHRMLRPAIALVTATLLGGLLAFFLIKQPLGWHLLPAASGLLIAVVFGLIGFRTALPRFYLLATASLILGGVFALSQRSNLLGLTAYCLALGLALLVSGGFILKRYLRQNPAPTETLHDQ